MDGQAIVDRRRLRRKLSFWRVFALVVVVAAIAMLTYAALPGLRSSEQIARISITGLVQDDDDLIKLIDDAGGNEAVKALVITISTPGGTTYGGERIHDALLRAGEKKPVVADVRTLAASAGYMIAASTDYIVAGESSIVGSIGVIFQYPQLKELLDKIGVRMEEIKSSPMKAEPSPFHDASPEAKAMIRALVLDSYDWFVDLVAEGRRMDRAKVLALADGTIFTGRQGLANGLVDELGGEAEIRAYLESRSVAPGLKIIDWEPSRETGGLFLPRISGLLFERLTGMPIQLSDELRELGGGKLFLDGLLSVWQFGHNDMKND
ncbi:signal peptide peptidase A [Hoeflea marina]|uniref:Signal peptide peptidase A n=1 Tax=Hoeflea marina TaxID=274592 RepID=A0A317PHG8_9HYPH|nr:signal peptide peptidase SppA [Hoeflea marina]PWW00079.1 signal peptide peptidase A [Hoeflea marina]